MSTLVTRKCCLPHRVSDVTEKRVEEESEGRTRNTAAVKRTCVLVHPTSHQYSIAICDTSLLIASCVTGAVVNKAPSEANEAVLLPGGWLLVSRHCGQKLQ
ncbi:hypothetical protein E2C01_040614 [Portunus trituberculatus]|uniref:Uncharacterized protein n=1 Tax=Portunus trituberculatus TaxID=210409 RepID=A0A5B7FR91_PORTR|nr:hypothetical protein [Portunus trituberculatus]